MRKLAWAIIIGLIAVVVWLVLALWNPGIAKLSNDGLTWALGSVWLGMIGIGTWVRTTASATNTAFLFYTVVILVVAVFFWAGVKKLLTWGAAHRPHLRTPSLKTSTPEVPTGVRGSTPPGATTRPETATTKEAEPLPELPVTKEETET